MVLTRSISKKINCPLETIESIFVLHKNKQNIISFREFQVTIFFKQLTETWKEFIQVEFTDKNGKTIYSPPIVCHPFEVYEGEKSFYQENGEKIKFLYDNKEICGLVDNVFYVLIN